MSEVKKRKKVYKAPRDYEKDPIWVVHRCGHRSAYRLHLTREEHHSCQKTLCPFCKIDPEIRKRWDKPKEPHKGRK